MPESRPEPPPENPGRKCKRCPAHIYFFEGPAGKPIPVTKIRTVYVLSAGKLAPVQIEGQAFVSHYETCPKASSFTRGRGSG